jgi:hypothetical protein
MATLSLTSLAFKRVLAVAALSCGAWFTPSANAEVFTFIGTLTGSAEAPSNSSPGTGSVIITVDTVADTMRVQASFASLTGPVTVAHIHCCTLAPFSGTAGVSTTTPTFPGFPAGVFNGTYDQIFNMDLASSYQAAFLASFGGNTETAFDRLVAQMATGNAYFNLHSATFPAGEIRAFLAPVPEPSTYALMGLGLLLVGWSVRRARQP